MCRAHARNLTIRITSRLNFHSLHAPCMDIRVWMEQRVNSENSYETKSESPGILQVVMWELIPCVELHLKPRTGRIMSRVWCRKMSKYFRLRSCRTNHRLKLSNPAKFWWQMFASFPWKVKEKKLKVDVRPFVFLRPDRSTCLCCVFLRNPRSKASFPYFPRKPFSLPKIFAKLKRKSLVLLAVESADNSLQLRHYVSFTVSVYSSINNSQLQTDNKKLLGQYAANYLHNTIAFMTFFPPDCEQPFRAESKRKIVNETSVRRANNYCWFDLIAILM